jgi:methylated-DNA-[protein]-cysteine S-methyltransferase
MIFNEKVWALCAKIPAGRVSTYGEIAKALHTRAYRAVGSALNRNPHGFVGKLADCSVPCHRVINSDGKVGGFAHGTKAKIALLKKEGIKIEDGKVNLERYLFSY